MIVAFFGNALLNFNGPLIRLQGGRFTPYESIHLGVRLARRGNQRRADRAVVATHDAVAPGQFRAAASTFPADSR